MTMLERISDQLSRSSSPAAIAVHVGGIVWLRAERDAMKAHADSGAADDPKTVFGFPIVEDPTLAPGTFEIRT
jgi:hypothetical protein